MPWTGALLSLGGLALVGSPPFNLFVSEFMILWATIEQGFQTSNFLFAAAALFLVAIMLIFAGLMRHLGPMLLGEPPAEAVPERLGQVGPLLILFLLILMLGFTLPTMGMLNLPQLLNQSTEILTCGRVECLSQ
jgi:hydrogenase-4 component F